MKFTIHLTPKNAKIKYSHVADAVYLEGYKIKVLFEDGTFKVVDFEEFLYDKHTHPMYKRYRKQNVFKKFEIKSGNLNWFNYEMIFPVEQLYDGKIL